jgi:hypothetical protein
VKTLSRHVLVGCLALLGLGLTTQKADAAFSVKGTIGANTATIFDGNVGNTSSGTATVGNGDESLLAGVIRTEGILAGTSTPGAFDVNGVQIGLFSTSTQSALQASVSSTTAITVFNSSASTQTLTLTVASTGFTLPGASGSIVTMTHALTILNWYTGVDIVNTSNPPSTMSSIGTISDSGGSQSTGSLGSATLPFSASNSVGFTRSAATFDLTQTFTITLGANQSVAFQGSVNVNPVPAPAGLVLLASALPVLGLRRIFRRKTVVA